MFYKLLVFIGSHLHSTMMKISRCYFLNVVLYHIKPSRQIHKQFPLLVGTMPIYSYFLLSYPSSILSEIEKLTPEKFLDGGTFPVPLFYSSSFKCYYT